MNMFLNFILREHMFVISLLGLIALIFVRSWCVEKLK